MSQPPVPSHDQPATLSDQWRGQWGGKIESGEEMWWSEPNSALWRGSRWARFKFLLDPRHYFILRFWRKWGATRKIAHEDRILDFGCGTGGTTLNFSRMIGHPINGLDLFPTQLAIAADFARQQKMSNAFTKLTDAGAIPYEDQSVTAIFSMDVLGHVPSIPNCLKDWARVLKPGGAIFLFTEANYSAGDRSIMARLARKGADMAAAVPEHISIWPKEDLEAEFARHGLRMRERFSANVWHFFFFPKDYVLLLKDKSHSRATYCLAWVWNRISKVLPFYPIPFHCLRIVLTRFFGRKAFGTSYFYWLEKAQ